MLETKITKLLNYGLLIFVVYHLNSCASQKIERNINNDETVHYLDDEEEIPDDKRWSKFPITVVDQNGTIVPDVMIVSARWPKDRSQRHGLIDDFEPLSEKALVRLMEANTANWLDAFLVKPINNLRLVGLTNKKGVEIEHMSTQWIQDMIVAKPNLTIPYGVFKVGVKPFVTSLSLSTINSVREITLTLRIEPQQQPITSAVNELLYETINLFKQYEILGHGMLRNTQARGIFTENFKSKVVFKHSQDYILRKNRRNATPSKFSKEQLLVEKSGDTSTACRLMYWRLKIRLKLHKLDNKPYDLQDNVYKSIKEQFENIKVTCKQQYHILSLRYTDIIFLHHSERELFRRNNGKEQPLPDSLKIPSSRKNWLTEAKNLQTQAGASLWPVFYQSATTMYYGADQDQLFEQLTWYKENYPLFYSNYNEYVRAQSAYSIGTRLRKWPPRYIKNPSGIKHQEDLVKWLGRAAEVGVCQAYLDLGNIYANGENMDVDNKQALYWYRNGLRSDCFIAPDKKNELEKQVNLMLKKI